MNTRRQSVTGWLLLLPAAVLLAAFTHYPALATFWHSFFTTPRANRSARFVGLENYELLLEDPVFWTALTNNAWYALGTILPSMALAIVMALWVNRQNLPFEELGTTPTRTAQNLRDVLHFFN